MLRLILAVCFFALGHGLSVSEIGNQIHISGINGQSHGEIGVYPNYHDETATLTYHTNDNIACSHLRIQVYRGLNKDPSNMLTSLCNDDVTETSTAGFKIVFDSDNSVHNGKINIQISAPHETPVLTHGFKGVRTGYLSEYGNRWACNNRTRSNLDCRYGTCNVQTLL